MTKIKPERTLVVAISHLLTQYQHLPPQWIAGDGKTRIVATNDIRYVVEADNSITKNSDLTILTQGAHFISGGGTHSENSRNNDYLPDFADGVIYQKRSTKPVMVLRMAALARKLGLKNFISPRIYSTHFADKRNSTFGPEIAGRVVVKPTDGARGIGQIVADMDKITPAFLVGLLKSADDKEAFLANLVTLAPHVEYHVGHGEIDEGLTSLVEQGWFVQQQVPNITEEYRLILDHLSNVAMSFKRKRDTLPLYSDHNSFEHKQATGVTHLLEDAKPDGEYMLSVHHEEISMLLQELNIPLNSVDLFVTDDGKWGIFEYCPQYGTEGIDQKIMEPFLRDQIERLLGVTTSNPHYMSAAQFSAAVAAAGIEASERG